MTTNQFEPRSHEDTKQFLTFENHFVTSCLRGSIVLSLFLTAHVLAQTVNDPNLVVQQWASGFNHPTGMAFLPDGRALVLEKETGKVRIMRKQRISGTALDLPVANDSERGLLGIALSPNFGSDHFVYLYYTAASADGGSPISNSVKRYSWDGSKLTFNRKVIDLPATPGPNHDGGRITFGPDGKLYMIIGDLNRNELTSNHNNGTINRIGAVLRVDPTGTSVTNNPFYSTANTGANKVKNDIYAYGIRNSFGMDFDPVSGRLWETENGPNAYDEINRITPGFNGGWETILGPTSRNGKDPSTLVSLGKAAHYSDPKFSWATPIAPTDALFLPTARLGTKYKDDLFVSTFNSGTILHFDLNKTRKALVLTGGLKDTVADNSGGDLLGEQSSLVFSDGYGSITDMVVGPSGMYVLAYESGIIYRITTAPGATPMAIASTLVPEPGALVMLVCLSLISLSRYSGRGQG